MVWSHCTQYLPKYICTLDIYLDIQLKNDSSEDNQGEILSQYSLKKSKIYLIC